MKPIHGYSVLFLLLTVVSACATKSPPLKWEIAEVPAGVLTQKFLPDPTRYLLLGYDSVSETAKNIECVHFKGKEELSPLPANPPVIRQLDAIDGSTREDLERTTNMSLSAKLGFSSFDLGGSARISKQYTSSLLHRHLWIYTKVEFPVRLLDLTAGLELTDQAKGFLADGTFFSQCGDSFIVGDKLGGTFSAIYLFRSLADNDSKVTGANLTLAVNAVHLGVALDFTNAIKKTTNTSQVFLEVTSVGPGDTAPSTPEEIWKYGKDFPAKAAAAPWPLAYQVTSYAPMLIPKNQQDLWIKHRNAAISHEVDLWRTEERQTALAALIQNAPQFGYVVPDQARLEESDLRGRIALREVALRDCLGAANCDALQPLPAVDRPPSAFFVRSVDPNDSGAQLLSGDPGVVVELLGRWTATYKGAPFQCDRVNCDRNSIVVADKTSSKSLANRANRTCLSPPNSYLYYAVDQKDLTVIKPKVDDPVRILIYPQLYKGDIGCVWDTPQSGP